MVSMLLDAFDKFKGCLEMLSVPRDAIDKFNGCLKMVSVLCGASGDDEIMSALLAVD